MRWELLANLYGLFRVAGFAQCLLSSWPPGFCRLRGRLLADERLKANVTSILHGSHLDLRAHEHTQVRRECGAAVISNIQAVVIIRRTCGILQQRNHDLVASSSQHEELQRMDLSFAQGVRCFPCQSLQHLPRIEFTFLHRLVRPFARSIWRVPIMSCSSSTPGLSQGMIGLKLQTDPRKGTNRWLNNGLFALARFEVQNQVGFRRL